MSKKLRIKVDPLSFTSLYLKLFARGHQISTATGFVVEHKGRNFLITNWHVLSGRDPETEQPLCKETAAIPDEIRIAHNLKRAIGSWRFYHERLYTNDDSPRWTEHPRGREVDVACLRLKGIPNEVKIKPLDLDLADVDLALYPAMPVSVIGFPLGLRPNALFGVWKTGHIASDPDLALRKDASFLIDATTREGMSGSPVVARAIGQYMTSRGLEITGKMVTRFLGIYSGCIHKDSEIGRVWHPRVIRELLELATT